MFDDIINHSYDNVEDYYRRHEQCIELNLSVLTGKIQIPDIKNRLLANQSFLMKEWSNKKLDEIVKLIT